MMNRKLTLGSSVFAGLCGILFTVSMFINREYFERVARDSVFSCQIRQLLAVILLFGIGFLFLLCIRNTLSPTLTVLLAFPVGICLWVFPAFLLLLLRIPFTFSLTMALITVILLMTWWYFHRFRKTETAKYTLSSFLAHALPLLLFFLGIAFWVSSGLIYVFVSYDSYFYFTNYGNTLTIVKNFRDIVGENSFTLTNISQFLPLLNSYTSFWGLDQCFQMQAFLAANIGAAFFHGLFAYDSDNGKNNRKKAAFFAALMTFLLVSSTSFLVASSWILANMYCMAYLFFAVILLEKSCQQAGRESGILSALFFTALTLLRKDGIIFVCFLLVYFALRSGWKRKTLCFVFLPSIVSELWWLFYVRVVLKATVEQAAFTSIANNANVAFVVAAITACCFYLFLLHPFLEKKLPFSETWLLYGGMVALLLLLTIRDWNQVVDNIDMTIRNMFLYPAAWGISGIFFAVLLTITLLRRPFWDADTFLWAGYVLLNFISYCAVGKNLWVNWDDSYSRIVLQIVPLFLFMSGKKLSDLLRSDTPDHSCGS